MLRKENNISIFKKWIKEPVFILIVLSGVFLFQGLVLRSIPLIGFGSAFFLIVLALKVKSLRVFLIPLITIVFTLSIIEFALGVFWTSIVPSSPQDASLSKDSNFVFRKVDGFGYLAKEGKYKQKKIGPNNELIYEANYTIGKDGYRLDVPGNDHKIYIYGNSNLFGEGINDNETLSYYLFKNHGIKSKNLGLGGFGIHQALYNIQNNNTSVDGINILLTNIGLAVRSTCKPNYSSGTPRYIYNENKKLVLSGVCKDKPFLYYQFQRSTLFRILERVYLRQKKYIEDADIEIYLAIIQEISRLSKDNNSKFIIAYMNFSKINNSLKKSEKFSNDSIVRKYKQFGDIAVDVTLAETYEQLKRKYFIHKLDTHATGQANVDRAAIIADSINKLSQ